MPDTAPNAGQDRIPTTAADYGLTARALRDYLNERPDLDDNLVYVDDRPVQGIGRGSDGPVLLLDEVFPQ